MQEVYSKKLLKYYTIHNLIRRENIVKSKSRKILSLLLALVLILPFMTITARAEGEEKVYNVTVGAQFKPLRGKYTSLPGATLEVVNKADTSKKYTGVTAENGKVDFKLPAGEYDITLTNIPENEEILKGKTIDKSKSMTKTVTVKGTSSVGSIVLFETDKVEEETPEVKTVNFRVGVKFKPAANNEGLNDYIPVEGAKVKLTNKDNNEVIEYVTKADGRDDKNIPTGKYTMELVSVPEELEGKFEWPAAKEFEINGPSFNGFNVVEIKEEETPTPGEDDNQTPGEDDNTGSDNNQTPEKSNTPEVDKITEGDDKITGKGEQDQI